MSLSLQRVELSNIRSHGDIVFEPEANGVTAIQGANGVGKSTLLDSIAWALYGTKPAGVSKVIAIAKEGCSPGKDKVFARVDFTIGTRIVRVERRIVTKQGGIECEVFDWDDANSSWTNVAGPAVSHAEPYIRKLLNMDEKGFLAAVLVQQKQVDQLISATAKERASVIEKLTGISSISSALVESRQEYNSLKKASKLSDMDPKKLTDLRSRLVTVVEDYESTNAETKKLFELGISLKNKGIDAKNFYQTEKAKFESFQAANDRIKEIKILLEVKQDQLNTKIAEKDALKKTLQQLGSRESQEETYNKHKSLESDRNNLLQEIAKLRSSITESKKALALAKKAARLFEGLSLAEAKKTIEQIESELQNESKVSDYQRQKAGYESTIASVKNAISVIRDSSGACPTCLQEVSDAKAAITSLESRIDECLAEIEALKSKIIEAEKAKVAQSEKRDDLKALVDALNTITEATENIESFNKRLDTALADEKTVASELKGLAKIIARIDEQKSHQVKYENTLAECKAISNEIESLRGESNKLSEDSKKPLSKAALNKLESDLDKTRSEYTKVTNKVLVAKGNVKLLEQEKGYVEEAITAEEAVQKKYKDLLKSVEIAGNRTTVLEEFRQNRIENSVPLIENYASDLLGRFTESKFTGLKIDGKFNAAVTLQDGSERAIGLLSGGELSAAAMALRLAISIVLNGDDSQNLIILDEVLVSQDSGRAELILNTIREVCQGQVILIAHNDSISDIADKLVELKS